MDGEIARRLQLALLLLLIGYVLWLLAPVLAPFALSALLAYLGDPLADRLERHGLGRNLAVTLVFGLMSLTVIGALLVLVPLIEQQVAYAILHLPDALLWFQDTVAPWLQLHLHVPPETFDPQRLVALIKQHWQEAGGIATSVLAGVTRSGLAVVAWLTNLVLVPVVTFYLLRDWDTMVARLRELLPREYESTLVRLAREADAVLGAFFRGQLLVMLALGLFYGLALWLVGIRLGPLIGAFAGLVSFVPYLGFITGLIASLIAAFAQYGDWPHVGLVLGVFAVGQTLEGYVLVPRLVGNRIGVHPVLVIFAILAGGQLFGFLGVLLALPVAAVTMVLLRYGHERYRASALYAHPANAAASADDHDAAPPAA